MSDRAPQHASPWPRMRHDERWRVCRAGALADAVKNDLTPALAARGFECWVRSSLGMREAGIGG